MIVTLVALPIIGLLFIASNGLEIGTALAASGSHIDSLIAGKEGWAAVAGVVGGLSWGLGYLGQPHLVTKFMAINNPKSIPTARSVAIIWTILAYGGAVLTGIVGITLVHYGYLSPAVLSKPGGDPERILPVLSGLLFQAWFSGILISGAIAAMMSTADSQLLITTSTVIEDFYSKALRREVSQKRLVSLSRIVTVFAGLAAYGLALINKDLIYDVVSLAWSGLGASFGPSIVLTLHWKRMNGAGVLCSMVTGAAATILWKWTPGLDALISVRFISFVLATLAAVIGSMAVKDRHIQMK